MLTTIVLAARESFAASPSPAGLRKAMRTLAALVPLAVGGFSGEVILAGPGSDAMHRLADEAGCALATGAEPGEALAAALARSAKRWRLVLAAGSAPEAGFADEASDFMAAGENAAAVLRGAPETFATRLFPALAPAAGVLALQAMFPAGRAADVGQLARLLRPAGVTLRTRARRLL